MSADGLDQAVVRAWARSHGVGTASVRGEQLLLGVAGQAEVGAYQLWVPGGRAHVVVARGASGSAADLLRDTVAEADARLVEAVVPGADPYVVVALAPGTERLDYRGSSTSAWREVPLDGLDVVLTRASAPGEGEALRTWQDGRRAVSPVRSTSPGAPDRPAASPSRPETPQQATPANLLGWPARGPQASGADLEALRVAYGREVGRPGPEVVRLASGDTDGGVRWVLAQAWTTGQPAQVVARIERPGQDAELHLQPATPEGMQVIGFLVTDQPGTADDLLVVVAEPAVVAADHRRSPTAPWRTLSREGGIGLVDRQVGLHGDALRLRHERGSTTTIPVADVLCPTC